jgi:hypothetical protein
MKIVYDTGKPPRHRVMFTDKDGAEHIIPAFCIQIQDFDGTVAKFSRWGDIRKRNAIIKAAMKGSIT